MSLLSGLVVRLALGVLLSVSGLSEEKVRFKTDKLEDFLELSFAAPPEFSKQVAVFEDLDGG